jgi:hypothetical protein
LAARKNDLAGARLLWIDVCKEFDRFREALRDLRNASTTEATGS